MILTASQSQVEALADTMSGPRQFRESSLLAEHRWPRHTLSRDIALPLYRRLAHMSSNPFIALEAEDGGEEDSDYACSDTEALAPILEEDDDVLRDNLPVFAGLEDDDDEDDPFNRFLENLTHHPPLKTTWTTSGNRIPPAPSDTPLWKLQCHVRPLPFIFITFPQFCTARATTARPAASS